MLYFPGSLHGHTDYSNLRLRDCIIKIEDLIDYAIELGHEVVAITDHDSVSNAIKVEKYYKKIKEKNPNFKVILGNEIYLCRNGLNNENFDKQSDRYYHFILLAKDAIGHQQIREISTRAWMRSYMARGMRRVPTYYSDLQEVIGTNPGHVIGSTACLGGFLATKLLQWGESLGNASQEEIAHFYQNIKNWILSMNNLFAGNFYLELQPSATREQTFVNRELINLSNELNIPYIITCDEHYLKKEDRFIHKAYLNAQDGDREVDAFYATTYLMDTEELESYLLLSREELDYAYQNILNIKNQCEDYSLLKPLKIPELIWKESKYISTEVKDKYFKLIPELFTFYTTEYKGDKLLAELIINRIEEDETLRNEKTYNAINECLEMTRISSEVNNTHWSAYFLNLQKIVDLCWEAGSLVGCGRGSGVGFILLYILGITQINPLRETVSTKPWRFLNPQRVSVLDVDIDITGSRRKQVLDKFREVYGEDRVANVITFGTEKSKSAILTAARGLGIDITDAQYISSLIPSDRGIQRTLHQCYYGDKENDYPPISTFVKEMNNNPELWQVAQKIEGLVCRSGIHAGGVIFVDEPFINSMSLMRAPDNTIITAFDLHDSEAVSAIKYDLLSVEALDKIQVCLELLAKDNLIKPEKTLKETYEKVIGIYNLEREAKEMWQMVWEHKILALFQMEQQSGIKGIALTKPESVEDLAHLNSVIRLMAQEKGGEQPINKYARFKNNISLWYQEMNNAGLTKEEQKILEPYLLGSYGICESQELFMELVQIPECGGFDLQWSDRLRKSIAKKNPAEYDALTKEYFDNAKEKHLSQNLCNYVWRTLIATSRGYGFNLSHTLSYSLIGLQEMNLAYKFPIIYWNCACLIVDSGSIDDESTQSTNYDKIARAIGKMKAENINIVPININKSEYSFRPDAEKNRILFGMKALLNVNDELVKEIIENRPYQNIKDFYNKVKPKKQAMISLIKSGAFDDMMDRRLAMAWYLWEVCDKKSRITLQNMPGLIKYNLLPKEDFYNFSFKIYEFNRYLKANCKSSLGFSLDERALKFLVENDLNNELIKISENSTPYMETKKWDKIYQSYMDAYREWIKSDKEQILQNLNEAIFLEEWNKYVKKNNLASWEMEVLCYYYHPHELLPVNKSKYGLTNFNSLPENPIVERSFYKGDKLINMYKLFRICGTCIAKNKAKGTVTLLTVDNTVEIKFAKEYFSMFDKRISQIQPDGTKKVLEKSWFERGSMIIVQGIRSGDEFIAKNYKTTGGHRLYKILDIDKDGDLTLQTERNKGIQEEDE